MAASKIFVTLTLVAALTALSACGRRGDLDSPYEAQVQARKDAKKANEPLPPEPVKPETDKPFVLDPLL
jgi:predicted small lipoprotein YifL